MIKVSSVEEYIEENVHFGDALKILQEIITSTELKETIKWNAPVYELKGRKLINNKKTNTISGFVQKES